MRHIEAVLWDMDGTLVESEAIAVEALAAALAEQGIAEPPHLYETTVGRSADAIYAWLKQEHGLDFDFIEWEMRKYHHYIARVAGLRGFEPAIDTWRRLEQAGIAQAVISNSDRTIVDVNLRSVGLAKPGLVTVSRNDIRHGKPDPEGYLRAAWLLGVDSQRCVVVEDSLSGAAAGVASGMTTFFVPHATVPAPTGVTALARMSDLVALVLREKIVQPA